MFRIEARNSGDVVWSKITLPMAITVMTAQALAQLERIRFTEVRLVPSAGAKLIDIRI